LRLESFPPLSGAYCGILKEFPEDALARFMIAECATAQHANLVDGQQV
jgi:hypothetical protein